jgi:hypothetical protein
MKRSLFLTTCLVLLAVVSSARAYIETPYSLGKICQDSTNILVVEVVKVNKEKNLIVFKRVEDLKGKHGKDEIKHDIGQRGFHAREWQNVMAWAEVGKKAVVFHNGQASEICIGRYWYECYPQGEWWAMTHAEPFLQRSYCGNAEELAEAVKRMLAGKEVVVPCMVDGNKDMLHQRKAKLQHLKASLKLQDYNPERDLVPPGGGGGKNP